MMLTLAIILLPLLAGLALLVARPHAQARAIALLTSLAGLGMAVTLWASYDAAAGPVTAFQRDWAPAIGLRMVFGYDGISLLMVLLTAIVFPFVIGAGWKSQLSEPAIANGLMLLTQSALFGVFLAQNAFLFYVFYELSLVPVFFLLLRWGGERRRAITMKFFIYTVLGGLTLLFGLVYSYLQLPPGQSADFSVLSAVSVAPDTQRWLFWVLFLGFAIKMPMFPLHSWQPDTYTMAPFQGTMILGGVMLKMGIYGVVRLVLPIVPLGAAEWQDVVIGLSLVGCLYAAWIAFRQNDLKRLVAWSSLSHVGLMCAALFTLNNTGITGALYQTLAHAIGVVALLYLVSGLQTRVGTTQLDVMGGLKVKMPRMAALFLLVMIGAVALPLTQGFVGEWLMFNGLLDVSIWWTFIGVISIILGAVYMLFAYQRSMLGEASRLNVADADETDHWVLVPLIAATFILGVYPQPVLDLLTAPVQQLIASMP